MVELLQKHTATEVMKTLQGLPLGLPGLYERILLQIEQRHVETSARILRLVITAARPFSIEELGAAIRCKPPDFIDAGQAIRDELTHCGPFVTETGGMVGFVHASVPDYLLHADADSNPPPDVFCINPSAAHFGLARVCIDSMKASYTSKRTHVIAPYARTFWPLHAQHSDELGDELIEQCRSFFEISGGGSKVLRMWWILRGERETTRIFYSAPRMRVDSRATPLHQACYLGIVPWARIILGPSAGQGLSHLGSPSDTDKYASSALHYAAFRGQARLVELLIEHGAGIHAQGYMNHTALDFAAYNGDINVVQLLLDCGADENHCGDVPRGTAVHYALAGGHEAVLRLLLAHRGDIHLKASDGSRMLHYAAGRQEGAVLRVLIEHGADVTAQDRLGRTALHIAAFHGNKGNIRALVKRGASLEARDRSGSIERGAYVDIRTSLGLTAVHTASSRGHKGVVRILLEHGAKPDIADLAGVSALFIAAARGYDGIVSLLVQHGAVDTRK